MSTTTTNLNMVLNEGQDKFSIPTLNENLTKIDTAIGEQNKKIGLDLLWENPSPNSPFADQTLNIAKLSEYKVLFINAKYDTNRRYNSVAFVNIIGQGAEIIGSEVKGTVGRRDVQITSANTLKIGACLFSGSTYNEYIVPLCIYGLKL